MSGFYKFLIFANFLLLVLITLAGVFDITRRPMDYGYCYRETERRFDRIHIVILDYYIENGFLPKSIEDIAAYDETIQTLDGWYIPIIYQRIEERKCLLTSQSQNRAFARGIPNDDLNRWIEVPPTSEEKSFSNKGLSDK